MLFSLPTADVMSDTSSSTTVLDLESDSTARGVMAPLYRGRPRSPQGRGLRGGQRGPGVLLDAVACLRRAADLLEQHAGAPGWVVAPQRGRPAVAPAAVDVHSADSAEDEAAVATGGAVRAPPPADRVPPPVGGWSSGRRTRDGWVPGARVALGWLRRYHGATARVREQMVPPEPSAAREGLAMEAAIILAMYLSRGRPPSPSLDVCWPCPSLRVMVNGRQEGVRGPMRYLRRSSRTPPCSAFHCVNPFPHSRSMPLRLLRARRPAPEPSPAAAAAAAAMDEVTAAIADAGARRIAEIATDVAPPTVVTRDEWGADDPYFLDDEWRWASSAAAPAGPAGDVSEAWSVAEESSSEFFEDDSLDDGGLCHRSPPPRRRRRRGPHR